MASKPEQKPKRVPIVLNMHLLDKEDGKDTKDSKDVKVEVKEEKSSVGSDKAKSPNTKANNDLSKDTGRSDSKGRTDEDMENGPDSMEKNIEGKSGDGSKEGKVCRDFLRNMCNRGNKCKFYHPAPNTSAADRRRNSWLVLCHDFQNGQCLRSDCRYFHITREDENLYRTTGEIHPLIVDQVMRKALYLDVFSPGVRPPCKEFLRGFCNLSTCRFRHLDRREYEDEVFRSLQEEFQIVFGPPEKQGATPYIDHFRQKEYRNSSWYDARPYDYQQDNLPHGDLRTSVVGQGGYEPDPKRRRHYSDERSYHHPSDSYNAAPAPQQRLWNDRMECDHRPPMSHDSRDIEGMMQEIANLRSDKIEITRRMDQENLILRDEMDLLTRENDGYRRDNAMLQDNISRMEASHKSTVENLMESNDKLVMDNRQLQNSLQKMENEVAEMRKAQQGKVEDFEKEKIDIRKTLSSSKESEQKMKDEVNKLKTEKEALQKIRDNLKAELERANHQLAIAKKNERNESDKPMYQRDREESKDTGRQTTNESSSFGRPGTGGKQENFGRPGTGGKQENWSNNARGPNNQQQQNDRDRQMRPDWPERNWGNQQQNDNRRPDWSNNQRFGQQQQQQQGPWRPGSDEKNSSSSQQQQSQSQSLLGAFPQQSSLLGQYPASAGKSLIQALSQFGGANKGQVGQQQQQQPDAPAGNKGPTGQQSADTRTNQQQDSQQRSGFGTNQGQNGQRSDMGSNQGPGGQRSNFGSNQGPGGQRPDFGSNQGPGGRRTDFGSNQGPGGQRSDFGSNQGPGQRSDFGPNQGPGGQRPDYGSNQGPGGQRSDFGSNQGPGGQRPDYGPNQGPGGQRSDLGSNQGQRPDFGPGPRSDYGMRQRSDYRSNMGQSGPQGYGSDLGQSGQRSDYGSNQSGRSGYGSNQGPSGHWSGDYGSQKSQSDKMSDYGSNRDMGGGSWSDMGSNRSQSGQRDSWNERSQGQSRGSFWGSEKDSNFMTSGSRLGERDYGLSGYDNGMRDSGFGGGSDLRGSFRSSWLREEEDRMAGRQRSNFNF